MNQEPRAHHRIDVLEGLLRQILSLEPVVLPPRELFDPETDLAVTSAFFLLGRDRHGGVEQFITHSLGRLLQQLSRSTERQQVEYRGQVRGRILWPATFKARYTQDYDPTRFVCKEVHSRYDTPENQLLKYVMERIDECLKAVPAAIWDGVCYLPVDETHVPLDTATRLGRMDAAMRLLWRNVRLREIDVPDSITEFHLLRAETAQLEEYARVAHVYRQYRDIVLIPSWNSLVRVGKRVLPLPGRRGEAENRWIRLGAAILCTQEVR
jgi:hypothetical protein